MMCCAAAWQLLRRDAHNQTRAFNFPFASLVPFVAIAFILWMLGHASAKEFETLGLLLLIGSALYFLRFYWREKTSPRHNIL